MDIQKLTNWFRFRNAADLQANELAEELTQLKLMKLLYLAQGVYLAAFNKPLFNDPIVAWKYGPAVESVHQRFAGQRGIVGNISDNDRGDYQEVEQNTDVSLVMNAVYDTYGDMSASDLVKLTHSQSPWRDTKQSQEISRESMQSYFLQNVLSND